MRTRTSIKNATVMYNLAINEMIQPQTHIKNLQWNLNLWWLLDPYCSHKGNPLLATKIAIREAKTKRNNFAGIVVFDEGIEDTIFDPIDYLVSDATADGQKWSPGKTILEWRRRSQIFACFIAFQLEESQGERVPNQSWSYTNTEKLSSFYEWNNSSLFHGKLHSNLWSMGWKRI